MTFSDLSTGSQNYLLVSHSYLLKWAVFLTIVFLSAYYVFVVWKKHEKTPFFLVAFTRFMLYGFSVIYLACIPYTLLLMGPEYSFYSFYTIPFILYSFFFSIGLIVVFFDFLRFGIFGMLSMAGLDVKDRDVEEVIGKIKDNKHFLKFNGSLLGGKNGRR